jgi:hypothetical protein
VVLSHSLPEPLVKAMESLPPASATVANRYAAREQTAPAMMPFHTQMEYLIHMRNRRWTRDARMRMCAQAYAYARKAQLLELNKRSHLKKCKTRGAAAMDSSIANVGLDQSTGQSRHWPRFVRLPCRCRWRPQRPAFRLHGNFIFRSHGVTTAIDVGTQGFPSRLTFPPSRR